MQSQKEIVKLLTLVSHIGFMMAIPIIGCIVLGSLLDRWLQTNVLWLIVFTILGVLSAFRNLFVIATRTHKK